MKKIRLGRTELMVGASSFGALPIQRLSKPEAMKLLREAYELGMNYFDTARPRRRRHCWRISKPAWSG